MGKTTASKKTLRAKKKATPNGITKKARSSKTPAKSPVKNAVKKKYPIPQAEFFAEDVKYRKYGFATRAIHAGNEPDPKFGGVAPAIDLSSTYA